MSVTVAGVVAIEGWLCVCETPILKRKELQAQWIPSNGTIVPLNPSNSKKDTLHETTPHHRTTPQPAQV